MAGGRGERRGPGRLPVRARRPGGQLGDWFWNASLRRPAPRPRRAGWSLASEQQVPGGNLTVRVGPAEETWEATESGETQRGVIQTGEPGPKDEPYDTPKLRERGREEEMGGRREEGSHGLSQIPRWPGPGREALTAALAPELGGDAGGPSVVSPGRWVRVHRGHCAWGLWTPSPLPGAFTAGGRRDVGPGLGRRAGVTTVVR